MIDRFREQYDWLSNFFMRDIRIGANIFPSAEHMFAACKTADMGWQQAIIQAATPAKAKKLGRECPLIPSWDGMRVSVMSYVLFNKFYQNPDLCKKLIETGGHDGHTLVEGNWWHDNFWGDCKFTYNFQSTPCPKCVGKTGQNKLGQLLMMTRDYFIKFHTIHNA